MSITIREAYENFYEPTRPRLTAKTIERYRLEVLRWERHTPNPKINEITTQTFHAYRASCLASGLKASTIETGIRTVLQILRLCGPEMERREGLGLIPKVPYVGRPLRQNAPFRPTPTVPELRLAYAMAGSLHWPPRVNTALFWRAWFGLSFVSAARLSDLLHLPATARQGDLLTLTAHKTDKALIVPLPGWLVEVLEQLPPLGDRMFPCKLLPCFIRREMAALSSKIGIQAITPHGIRRASITEWSKVNDDCGKIIHGVGLGIRDRYVDRLSLLRSQVNSLPDLSRVQ